MNGTKALCGVALLAALLGPAAPAIAEPPKATWVASSTADLGRPHDLAVTPDGLYLLVTDMENDRIRVLNPGTLAVVGDFGDGDLAKPHDLAFEREGRVLIADTANDRIRVYRFDGVTANGFVDAKPVASWEDGIDWPEGVDVSPEGRIFVTNVGTATLVEVNTSGKVINRIGGIGSEPGKFSRPHDVHVDGKGRVLVADSGNHRVQVFDQDLRLLKVLDPETYGFREPKYISDAPGGRLYIADEYNNRIVVLDPDFAFLGALGDQARDDLPKLNRPEGIDATDRYLWVSDTYNDRVVLWRLQPE